MTYSDLYINSLMTVAATQAAEQHIRSSLGLSILCNVNREFGFKPPIDNNDYQGSFLIMINNKI